MTYNARLTIYAENGTFPEFDIANIDGDIRREDTGQSTADLGDGYTMESFILFCHADASTIIANIRLLEQHLNLAEAIHDNKSPHERIRLIKREQDERASRVSTVIGGSVTPISDAVATTDLRRDTARYAITITRHTLWEFSTVHEKVFNGVSMHGGVNSIPPRLSQGVQAGRIKTMTIAGAGNTRLKRFWMGIKPAYTDISGFDPEIEVKNDWTVQINADRAEWVYDPSNTGYLNDYCVACNWGSGTDWDLAYYAPLRGWNTSTGTVENRKAYYGKYHLLCRYKTSSDNGETYGIQAAYGWLDNYDGTKLERMYFEPTDDNFRYADLGIITVGGDGFTTEIQDRGNMSHFTISIHAAVFDKVEDDGLGPGQTPLNYSVLYLDNLYLVPAEHFLFAEVDTQIGGARYAARRAEIYGHENGSVNGLVAARTFNFPTTIERNIYDSITEIDYNNWTIPAFNNSRMVLVGDCEGSTLNVNALATIRLETLARTVLL